MFTWRKFSRKFVEILHSLVYLKDNYLCCCGAVLLLCNILFAESQHGQKAAGSMKSVKNRSTVVKKTGIFLKIENKGEDRALLV